MDVRQGCGLDECSSAYTTSAASGQACRVRCVCGACAVAPKFRRKRIKKVVKDAAKDGRWFERGEYRLRRQSNPSLSVARAFVFAGLSLLLLPQKRAWQTASGDESCFYLVYLARTKVKQNARLSSLIESASTCLVPPLVPCLLQLDRSGRMLLRPAHQRQLLRRTAACFKRTSVAGSGLPRVRHKHTQSSGSSSSSSDAELRAVFDDLSLWTSIATSRRSAAANNTAKGLFGHDHLRAPADLSRLTEATMVKANTLVRRICDLPSTFAKEATSREDALLVTSIQFDRLSDLLCSVIDPCEAIRNVVSQPDWKLAAERTYAELCEYMNILNTHTGLYEVSWPQDSSSRQNWPRADQPRRPR